MAKIPSKDIQDRSIVPFLDMENTPLKEKSTHEYNLRITKSIYSYYTNNKTEIPWNRDKHFDYLRKIGQGKQSVDSYKRFLSKSDNNYSSITSTVDEYIQNTADANRYGWMSYIEDNLSPIANVKGICKSDMLKGDYDILADVVDVDAVAKEDEAMLRQYVLATKRDFFNGLRQRYQLPINNDNIITDRPEELLDIKMQGGFKAHHISAVQQTLKHTEEYSDWDRLIKEKLFDDIFDLGYGFATPKYCPITHKTKWIYLDPKDVIIQYSDQYNFKDSQYFGWFEYLPINKLRGLQDRITNGKKNGLSDDDWNKIGSQYAGYNDNPDSYKWKTTDDDIKIDLLNESNVCVLHVYWIDYESGSVVKFNNPYGKTKLKDYKNGDKLKNGDEVIYSREQKVYRCSWIVGTNYIFDYGVMPNQPKKNLKEVYIPFAGFKMKEKSYTERLAPLAHTFGVGWMRLCNAIAKAQNDFYYVDVSALADVQMNNVKLTWQDLIAMMRQENVLLGDSNGGVPTHLGGTGVPIQKVAGTLQEDMMKEIGIMDWAYNEIEKLIGLSPVALGGTPQRDQAVRNTEMSINSSSKGLDVLFNGVMIVKESLAEISLPMNINAIRYDDDAFKSWSRVIGSDDVEVIRDYDWGLCDLGIKLKARPSQELKDWLMKVAEVSIQKRNNGLAGIKETDMIWLKYHFDTGGDFLEAFYKLRFWERQDEKRLEREKKEAIQLQGQQNKDLASIQAEEERKNQQMNAIKEDQQAKSKALYDSIVNDKEMINDLNKLRVEWMINQGQDPIGEITKIQDDIAFSGTNTSLLQPQTQQSDTQVSVGV